MVSPCCASHTVSIKHHNITIISKQNIFIAVVGWTCFISLINSSHACSFCLTSHCSVCSVIMLQNVACHSDPLPDHNILMLILYNRSFTHSYTFTRDAVRHFNVGLCIDVCFVCTSVRPFLRAKAATYCFQCVLAIAVLSVRPSICHTGGSIKNGTS